MINVIVREQSRRGMPAVCQRKRRENRKAEVTTVSLLVGVGVLRSACHKSACQGPLYPLLKYKLSLATEKNSSADFWPLKEGEKHSKIAFKLPVHPNLGDFSHNISLLNKCTIPQYI